MKRSLGQFARLRHKCSEPISWCFQKVNTKHLFNFWSGNLLSWLIFLGIHTPYKSKQTIAWKIHPVLTSPLIHQAWVLQIIKKATTGLLKLEKKWNLSETPYLTSCEMEPGHLPPFYKFLIKRWHKEINDSTETDAISDFGKKCNRFCDSRDLCADFHLGAWRKFADFFSLSLVLSLTEDRGLTSTQHTHQTNQEECANIKWQPFRWLT